MIIRLTKDEIKLLNVISKAEYPLTTLREYTLRMPEIRERAVYEALTTGEWSNDDLVLNTYLVKVPKVTGWYYTFNASTGKLGMTARVDNSLAHFTIDDINKLGLQDMERVPL